MKKVLKNTLNCLCLLLLLVFVVSCSCNNDETKKEKDSIYKQLNQISENIVSGDIDVLETNTREDFAINYSLGENNLEQIEKKDILQDLNSNSVISSHKEKFGYNLKEGIGYDIKSLYDDSSKLYNPYNESYIVKDSDNYYNYTNRVYEVSKEKVEDKRAYYVGEDYLKKKVFPQAFSNVDILIDINNIAQFKTYSAYKDNLVKEFKEYCMGEKSNAISAIISLNDRLDYRDGIYSLKIEIKIFNYNTIIDNISYTMSSKYELTIEFDGEMIIEYMEKIVDEGESQLINLNQDSNKTYNIIFSGDISTTTQLTKALDQSIINADYNSYINDEISGIEMEVIYMIDGYRLDAITLGRYGDQIDIIDSKSIYSNATLSEWYLDKEYTIKLIDSNIDTYPSYNITLYAKTLSIDKGYAKLIVITRADEKPYVANQINFVSVIDRMDLTSLLDYNNPYIEFVKMTINNSNVDINVPFYMLENETYIVEIDYKYNFN